MASHGAGKGRKGKAAAGEMGSNADGEAKTGSHDVQWVFPAVVSEDLL